MIRMSGRELSRAWQAVALASGDVPSRPLLFRTVHVEEFENGLRIIATDSYWLAICWVPAEIDRGDGDTKPEAGFDFEREPGIDEVPLNRVTVRDDEWLVRDLMKRVAKATRKNEDPDVPIIVDLAAAPPEEPAQPALSPDMEPVRCRFEVLGSLRVLAGTIEGEYPNWRQLDQLTFTPANRAELGANVTTLSWWMLERLSKVPKIVGCGSVRVTWLSDVEARWDVTDGNMASPPRGLFMANRRSEPVPDDDDADDGFEQPPIEDALPDGSDPLFCEARTLVRDRNNASHRMLYQTLKIGPARANVILDQLEAAGVVSAKVDGKRVVLERWSNE